MALTNTEKNLAICQLEKMIDDSKTSAGVSDLGEFDTDAVALRTAFDTDPDTALPADIQALREKVEGFAFGNISGLSALWTEIEAEASA